MKIAILGYTGAGKSTLARKIGEKYNVPVLHLDKVNYNKNWKASEAKEIVDDFLENDAWVIDGNYSKSEQDRRFKEADKIIFLDFPRSVCFHRAYKKYCENKENKRKDVANVYEEKFDFEIIKWILFEGRNKEHKQKFKNICDTYSQKVVICKNTKEVEEVLKSI